MDTRKTLTLIALSLVLLLTAACSAGPDSEPEPAPVETPGDPTSGLRLAPGLYDQEDGTVLAIGTLEYRDLEGGFWAVIDGTVAAGGEGEVAAVIANGADFAAELEALDGAQVSVTATRLDGASIRMAGPEIEMTAIEEITDTGGIAE